MYALHECLIYDCCKNIFNNASGILRVLSKCNLIILGTLREMKRSKRAPAGVLIL